MLEAAKCTLLDRNMNSKTTECLDVEAITKTRVDFEMQLWEGGNLVLRIDL